MLTRPASGQGAPLLVVEGLRGGPQHLPVLDGLTFDMMAGERLVIVGPNGVGKSTLLRSLLGLVPVTADQLQFADRRIGGLSTDARIRLGIGYVPEGRRMFPGLTVAETLTASGLADGRKRAADVAHVQGLFPTLAQRRGDRAWQLSGGQQQMLAIARALMGRPRLLLLDEPFQGLAPTLVDDLAAAIRRIAETGTAVLLVDPEPGRAGAVQPDRVMRLDAGHLHSA